MQHFFALPFLSLHFCKTKLHSNIFHTPVLVYDKEDSGLTTQQFVSNSLSQLGHKDRVHQILCCTPHLSGKPISCDMPRQFISFYIFHNHEKSNRSEKNDPSCMFVLCKHNCHPNIERQYIMM